LAQNIDNVQDEEEQVEEPTGKSQDKADGTEINVKQVESADTGTPGPSSAADR